MRPLHEIGDDLRGLDELLSATEGEIPEGEIGAAIEAWFAQLGEERDEKIRRICALIHMKETNAKNLRAEASRLEADATVEENGAERLRKRVKLFFEAHRIQKLNLGIFRPRIQANGGKRALIFPEAWAQEPASAPERYHKPVITLDTKLMREDAELTEVEIKKLKASLAAEEITAEEYYAAIHIAESTNPIRLAEQGSHLRLR